MTALPLSPTADTTVELWTTTVTGESPVYLTSTSVFIEKIGGFAPILGTTVDFTQVTIANGATAPAAGSPIALGTATGNMSVAGNNITLKAGKTYGLKASIARTNGTPNSAEFTYQFRDTTNNADLGSPGPLTQNTALGAGGIAEAIVSVPATGDITIQLWSKKNTAVSTLDANSGTNAGTVIVQQIGSTVSVSPQVPVVQRFTASGTYTPSLGMKFAIVKAVGGGGAGGGAAAAQGASTGTVGAGGNSGAYVEALLTAAQIGSSQTVTIGAGGVGGTAAGGSGGNTTLGSLLTAAGGSGGLVSNTNSNFQAGLQTYSMPGTVTSPTVTTGVDVGSAASRLGQIGTAGGSSSFAGAMTGSGADSMLGAVARGSYTNVGVAGPGSIAGVAAPTNSGGGGSGAWSYGAASLVANGGNGGSGLMIITEYF